MREIVLTNGMVAKVDDDDFESLNATVWWAHRGKRVWYAARKKILNYGKENKRTITILMHRQILGDVPGPVDHIDGDGLNNTRANLRPVTVGQNTRNSRKRRNCSSAFKGVYWNKKIKRWNAQVSVNGKQTYVGVFRSEEEAARAYDKAVSTIDPEHARFNFPGECR